MAVLFDLDGTLFDHASATASALEELYETHSLEIERGKEAFFGSWALATHTHWRRYESGEIGWAHQGRLRIKDSFGRFELDDDAADRLFANYVSIYERHWTLFPDALPCLERLRGRPLGIVTNGYPQQQRKKLRKLGLREHFKEVLIAEEIGTAKPSPGIFLEASRRLWSLPGECIVVGDSWSHDVEGGLRAGMQPIWLDRVGSAPRPHVPVIKGLSEIPDLVEHWQTAKPEEVPALDFVI